MARGVSDFPRRPGRPRSEQANQAIKAATLEELASVGYEALTVEGVAQRAGVGKSTIYRRWSSKQALVLAALQEMQAEVPIADTGHLRQDLLTMVEQALALGTSNRLFRTFVLRAAIELAAQPELLRDMLTELLPARFQEFAQLIERAKTRGELRADLDTSVALSLIAGPIFYHWLVGGIVSPLPSSGQLAEQLVDAMLRGMASAK
jgi:AcrR family transcriptional regulator